MATTAMATATATATVTLTAKRVEYDAEAMCLKTKAPRHKLGCGETIHDWQEAKPC